MNWNQSRLLTYIFITMAGMLFSQSAMADVASDNMKAGQDFSAKNKTVDGVVELPSGLQYKVLAAGDGEKPGVTNSVTVHYKGTLINGKEFDSSYSGQPATFPLNHVIRGWTEGLQLMQEGAKYRLFIPSDLAYGARGPASIGPNQALIFDVELIKVN